MKLYNRLSSFYIVINVPKCLRKRIGKSQIWRSLHTKDRRIANLRAGMIKMSVHKLARRAVQVYKMSDAKNPVKTGNRVVDFATGRLPLVKDWNKGFNLGKLGFVAQQTYKDTCKRKK